MKRFAIEDTPLSGLKLVRRQTVGDTRGSLSRVFCADELADAGWDAPIAQINHTATLRKGTVRGMHFQRAPFAEAKLVSCISGEVWDVAVDIRAGSPTFGCWHAERLSASNGVALLIPIGFAHGFQSLTDDVGLVYCHSSAHAPNAEAGLHPLDEKLRITWPLAITELSERDAAQLRIQPTFEGIKT